MNDMRRLNVLSSAGRTGLSGSWAYAMVVILALGLAPIADAHQNLSAEYLAHLRQDTVPTPLRTTGELAELLDTSRMFSRLLARMAPAAHAATGSPDEVGQWAGPFGWPLVAVHATLLPNGKVLAFDSVGDLAAEDYATHNFTRAVLWDPDSFAQTTVNLNTGYNIFCSGLALLPDGRAFIAGGNLNSNLDGLNTTHIFDYTNNQWSRGPFMSEGGRWYPSVTPLANGEMLITGGGPITPEVRRTDGSLRTLTGAMQSLPLYPWMHTAPNGRVTYFGPDQTLRSLATDGAGSWITAGQRDNINRTYGGFAAYDIGKVLVAGGGESTRSARIVDLNSMQVAATGAMNHGRRQHNLTILADGSVLATGGNSSGEYLVDMGAAVYPAEVWNPATGQWTELARMQKTRQYHSIALLLPDGRVLSAGGGICNPCTSLGYINRDAEIFSPPYLFKKDGSGDLAARPGITGMPATVGYARTLQITTPDAGSIAKVALVRNSAVTHSVNFTQRYIPLSFTRGRDYIQTTSPANANLAPPGDYLAFLINSDGVPSYGRFVRLDADAPAPNLMPALSTPANQTGTLGERISLAVQGSDPEGGALNYRSEGLPSGLSMNPGSGEIAGTLTARGTYNVILTVTDNQGATANAGFVWLVTDPQEVPPSAPAGLAYEYYQGQWSTFPTFGPSDVPVKAGLVRNFTLAPRLRDTEFALRYRGKIRIPRAAEYTFYLKSTNASRLWLDGTLIVRNRSGAIQRENSGKVYLLAGEHALEGAYVSGSAPPTLLVTVSAPDVPKQPIPREWLLQPAANVVYQLYNGRWSGVPDFDPLTPVASGFTSLFDLSPRQRTSDYALRFKGTLNIDRVGRYRFYIRVRSAAVLRINGVRVVRVASPDQPMEGSGALNLQSGAHAIELDYVQTDGVKALEVQYRGPGLPRQPLGLKALQP